MPMPKPQRVAGRPTPPTVGEHQDPDPRDEVTAFDLLLGLARRRTGPVPVEVVVRHVLAVTGGADSPVQRAALDAVLRRFLAAERDGITARPLAKEPGFFTTGGRHSERTYRTLLVSSAPLKGSCECPDFIRGSLGLCKHLVAALVKSSSQKAGSRASRRVEEAPLRLVWDPVRPLLGPGDWLERVSLAEGPGKLPSGLGDIFGSTQDGVRSLRPEALKDREGLLEQLVRGLEKLPASDPALRPLIAGERERTKRAQVGAALAKRLPKLLAGFKRKLYPYQLEGVARFLGAGRLLLADDMGLGKTAQAIAACHALHAEKSVTRGLLIVPSSLKPQWLREWQAFTNKPARIVEGPPEARAALYRDTRDGFLIASYEQAVRDRALMQAWDPQLVVLDEAQRIKNWQTKTAFAVKELRPAFRLVLTGTPLENRLEELASLLDWVDDHALEPKWRLGPWHTTVSPEGAAVGARNLATLRDRLAPSFLRRRKQEVLEQLPPRTDTRIPSELTPPQAEAHAELDLPIAQLVVRSKKRPLSQPEFLRLMSLLTRQRMICNGLALASFEEIAPTLEGRPPSPALLESLCTPKLLEWRELVSNLVVEQERKVVIFSQWRRMLQLASWAVGDLLEAACVRAAWFTGGESQSRRTQHIDAFHADPAVRVLFCSDAGGVGLNLQGASSVVVNLELPWNPAVLEQRIGRVYRLGQKQPVEVYNLVSESGIEARIAGLVASKQVLFSGLFDGTSDEVSYGEATSFLARIEKLVDVPETPATTTAQPAAEDDLDASSEAAPEPARPPEVPAAKLAERAESLPSAPPAAAFASADLGALLAQVRIAPNASGGVTIDAPREAATALAAFFGELAQRLGAAGR